MTRTELASNGPDANLSSCGAFSRPVYRHPLPYLGDVGTPGRPSVSDPWDLEPRARKEVVERQSPA